MKNYDAQRGSFGILYHLNWSTWTVCLDCGWTVVGYTCVEEESAICPHCGGRSLENLAGREVWDGKWFLPWTWFQFSLERKRSRSNH